MSVSNLSYGCTHVALQYKNRVRNCDRECKDVFSAESAIRYQSDHGFMITLQPYIAKVGLFSRSQIPTRGHDATLRIYWDTERERALSSKIDIIILFCLPG